MLGLGLSNADLRVLVDSMVSMDLFDVVSTLVKGFKKEMIEEFNIRIITFIRGGQPVARDVT